MSKVKLIFGTQNAVPAAEPHDFYEKIYARALKPFLTTIYNHSNICTTLFYSGSLLEWINKHHPEFIDVLAELMGNKSIEILSGAYWEPMLSLIPSSDRTSQIELMTTYLRQKFSKRSMGSWISGQVWESYLASSLRSTGMDYAFLTERAFPWCQRKIQPPVIAEDQGKTIVLFPVMDRLADEFLKVPPERIIESLYELNSMGEKESVVTLILDGQKFGSGSSFRICYDDKWLERFFKAIADSHSWLECIHPRQYLRDSSRIMERAYMSGPSYKSLMTWALNGVEDSSNTPQNQVSTDYRVLESYRKFFTKYRESNFLYAKMIHIVVLSNQIRGDKERKKNAKEALWRGQEHYAYWHGPSGGIYRSRLRYHAYNALIEAEKITRERGVFKAALTSMDFDMDGELEFLYHGTNLNAYVHKMGGVLFELDYLPMAHNYLATFSRYREDYHSPVIVSKGYDTYPRHAFIDHIYKSGDEFIRQKSPFPYIQYTKEELVRDQSRIMLRAVGPANSIDNALQLDKTYLFHRNSMEVEYRFTNLTHKTLKFSWGSEINLALANDPDLRKVFLNMDYPDKEAAEDSGLDSDVKSWIILDEERTVLLQFNLSEPSRLLRKPMFADFRDGGEFCHGYQGSLFMPIKEFELSPATPQVFKISLQIIRPKK